MIQPAGDRFFRSETDVRLPLVRLYEDEGCLDGFSGGGGTSTGIEMAIGRSPDVAINHDKWALAMHEENHPTTRHIPSNIRKVSYRKEMRGKRCRFAWFSPDCTYFSKARGGAPFRDRNLARRIRGLAWEVVRCAIEIRPDVIFMENVEEYKDWCPLGADGRPDPAKKGASFRRWVSRLRNLGGVVEWRELRASHFGAPTSRKRLFVIIRFDGQPVVWPEPTHGPGLEPYRTAAECIDFNLPVPSIFLTPKEAKAWGKAHGVAAPKRPLVKATKRRIARGVFRFVLENPEPFIVNNSEQRDDRVYRASEPIRTLTAAACRTYQLVQPTLAPFITEHANASTQRNMPADEPLRTICAQVKGGHFALVAPSLVKFHGERRDGSDEVRGQPVTEPIRTLDTSNRYGLVAAFLAKHNGGHEATGQQLGLPIDTVTTRDSKALIASNLVKLRGGLKDHHQTSQDIREPAPTLTAGGTHVAEVRTTLLRRDALDSEYLDRAVQTCAFLVKYYGTGVARAVDAPAGTITTKDRLGLVTVILVRVGDSEYVLVDIGMRMLTPRELFLCQGFPIGYQIEHAWIPTPLGIKVWTKLTKKDQTRLVGNSVPPHLAAALLGANLARPVGRERAA